MKRRQILQAAAGATGMAALAWGGGTAHAVPADGILQAGAAGPPTLTPADIRFPRVSRPLAYGSPQQVGLLAEHVERIADEAAVFMEPGPGRPAPSHPGFVLMAVRDGVIVSHEARGHALRYAGWDSAAGVPVELPADQWVPMTRNTLFDMASVTKLFTSTVAVQLVEQGVIGLDEPVVRYLPEFAATDPAKAAVTIRMFLTHRSGLIAWTNLYSLPDNAARMQAIYNSKLQRPVGSGYEYSDLNLITLGHLMERMTGQPLDELIAERVTGPLGLKDTMFNPPEHLLPRIAATEYQPGLGRGMIRGSVHDENAWSFGGVAGHAGIFSTARDLAILGQMIADGGKYGRTRILSEDMVREVLTDQNADIGASPRGLGWQVDQRFYMDALNSRVTAGHTGYTGTCITVDPVNRMVFVLLTNRVHPTRNWGTDSIYRRMPAGTFARALPVRPATGREAWFAGMVNNSTSTLTAPLGAPTAAGRADFQLWYDTEQTWDKGSVQASTDGGTTFTPVPLTLSARGHGSWTTDGTFDGYSGRQWLRASAQVPAGTTHLRWTYSLDTGSRGRGVYVDEIRVFSGDRLVFNGDRPADAARLTADGWTRSAD